MRRNFFENSLSLVTRRVRDATSDKGTSRAGPEREESWFFGLCVLDPREVETCVLAHHWGCLNLRGCRKLLTGGQPSRTVGPGPSGDALAMAVRKRSPERGIC